MKIIAMIVLMVGAILPASAAPNNETASNATRLTREQCFNAFNISSAARTCQNTTAIVADPYNCGIATHCRRNNGAWQANYRVLPYSQVSLLKNCDGTLC